MDGLSRQIDRSRSLVDTGSHKSTKTMNVLDGLRVYSWYLGPVDPLQNLNMCTTNKLNFINKSTPTHTVITQSILNGFSICKKVWVAPIVVVSDFLRIQKILRTAVAVLKNKAGVPNKIPCIYSLFGPISKTITSMYAESILIWHAQIF